MMTTNTSPANNEIHPTTHSSMTAEEVAKAVARHNHKHPLEAQAQAAAKAKKSGKR
jgi:hypothetical protein